MIVDDNPVNLKLIYEYLKRNFETFQFLSGVDIVKDAIKINPDVILLDVMMPIKTGYECLEELNKHDNTKDIPVILVTALSDYEDIKKGMSYGAFDYIKKPVNNVELLTKIDLALKFQEKNNVVKKYKMYANINESLLYAKRIQDSILPDKTKLEKIFGNIKILYNPRDILSGDFYWAEQINNKKYLFLGDCTGHGVPGCILSVIFSTLLHRNTHCNKIFSPSKIFEHLSYEINELLNTNDTYTNYDGADAAMIILEDETIYYSGAYIDLIIVSEKDIIFNNKPYNPTLENDKFKLYNICSCKTSIGRESIDYIFSTFNIKVNKGDRIYLWTDGIYEQIGLNADFKVKKYSKRKFLEFLLSIQDHDINAIECLVLNETQNWRKELDQLDDITFIGLEV
jgi:DNA-binding response OmpR family regulator